MMRFPPEFIDRVRANTLVSEVVGRRVALRRNGREFGGLCPFHKEKTPSFTVNDEKGFYHCFGCGAHGSAIRFLMEYDGLGFIDSINELAQMAGVDVPREAGESTHPSREKSSPLYELLEQANRYYRRQLREHPGGQKAVTYLKDRGVSGEIAGRFEVGFAPPGWDNLSKTLADVPAQLLLDGGLTSQSDQGSHYDRLRDRIRGWLSDEGDTPTRYLLIDFRRATGIDSSAVTFYWETTPEFVQTEMVWDSTQTLSPELLMQQEALDTACEGDTLLKNTEGESPLRSRVNRTNLDRTDIGGECGIYYSIFAGGAQGTPAGFSIEQKFTWYVTSFYGFEPDEDWWFIHDGFHPAPV